MSLSTPPVQKSSSRHGTAIHITSDRILAILAWVALLAFVLITVAPGLTGDHVFLGTEILNRFTPWNFTANTTDVTNSGIGDTIDSASPMAHLIVSLTESGTFPQWDPYNNGGTELGALPNAGILSPLSLAWWLLPAAAAPAGVKIAEILAIALGMHLLLRRQWGLPAFTAPLAALVFISSGFMVAWTNWPQTRVAALIPLLFWVTDRLVTRHQWFDVVPMGIVVASMLLGGFPAVTGYAIYAAIAYFVVRAIGTRTPVRMAAMSFLRSAVGVVIGIALSACQILPFAWFSTHYVDFAARSGSKGGHLPFKTLATSIVPDLLGLPDGTHSSWPIHFVEGFSYTGAAALILAAAAILVHPQVSFPRAVMPFFAGLTIVVSAAVYIGGPPLTVIQLLPGISTSPSGRLRVLIGFSAAVLTGLGSAAVYDSQGLRQQLRSWRTLSVWRIISAVFRSATALTMTIPVIVAVRQAVNPDELLYSEKWVLVTALFMAITLITVLFAWLIPSRATGFLTSIIILSVTVVPSIDVARTWWPLSDADTFYAKTSTHEFLDENLGQERYVSVGQAMLPGSSSFYQLRALNGHGFTTPAWNELLMSADPAFYLTPTYTALNPQNSTLSMRSPILDRLAVKYVVQSPELPLPGTADQSPASTGRYDLSSATTVSTGETFGSSLGIRITIVGSVGLTESPATLIATAVSDDGTELAQTTLKLSGIGAQKDIPLQLGDIAEDMRWHVDLKLIDSSATITLATDDTGALVAVPVRSEDSSLTTVHTGDSTILERTTALNRIRWANKSVVEANQAVRLDLLSDSDFPASTVVLEHESDTAPDSESTAEIAVHNVNTDTVAATITSTGPGWVVIADPMRGGGWTATLDGQPVELIDADNAIVTVHVDNAGTHELVLRYEAPLFRVGSIVSAVTLIGVISVSLIVLVRKLSRRRAGTTTRTGFVGLEQVAEGALDASVARDGQARPSVRHSAGTAEDHPDCP